MYSETYPLLVIWPHSVESLRSAVIVKGGIVILSPAPILPRRSPSPAAGIFRSVTGICTSFPLSSQVYICNKVLTFPCFRCGSIFNSPLPFLPVWNICTLSSDYLKTI